MPKPQFVVPAGFGELMRERRHYSQAVRVGDLLLVAGQGGWRDDLSLPSSREEQLRLAFANVATVLASAGSSWSDVVEVTSYHLGIDPELLDAMVGLLREHCPDHRPLWTVLGVAALARPEMTVEITVRAVLDPS
jgi:enamine deaminase RidA (YjgF/YER057c/UK114 family)